MILKFRKTSEMFQSGLDLICPPSNKVNKVNKEVYFNCVKYLVNRNYDVDTSLLTCKNIMEKKEEEKNVEKFQSELTNSELVGENDTNFDTNRSNKCHLANMEKSSRKYKSQN